MVDTVPQLPLRERLRDLNAKAYYLLVALSFLYTKATNVRCSLKMAITLTALVAALPVQDLSDSRAYLERIRWGKITALTFALAFTLYWIFS